MNQSDKGLSPDAAPEKEKQKQPDGAAKPDVPTPTEADEVR